MSTGLNPSGLGRSETFGTTKHEAIDTEKVNNETVYPETYPGDDLGEQINNMIADVGRADLEIRITGSHTVSTTADLTNLENVFFNARGASITLATAGQASLDFCDSRDLEFVASELIGDETDTPTSGVLMGNPDGGGVASGETFDESDAERNWFHCTQAKGDFDYAPLFVHGRERTRISGDWQNNNDQGYAVIASQYNHFTINGTPGQSETSPIKGALGNSSVGKLWIEQASFFSRENEGDGCFFTDTGSIGLTDTEFRSVGEPCIVANCSQSNMNGLTVTNCRPRTDISNTDEAEGSTTFIYVNDESAGNTLSFIKLNGVIANLADPPTAPNGWVIECVGNAAIGRLDFGTDNHYIDADRVKLQNAMAGSIDGGAPENGNEGTTFDGGDRGVPVAPFDDGVVVKNCSVKTDPAGSMGCVRMDNADEHQLLQNVHVIESGSWGIYVRSGTGWRIANCSVGSNTGDWHVIIDGVEGMMTGTWIDGMLRFDGSSRENEVRGCYIAGNLEFKSGATGNRVYGYVGGSVTYGGTGNVVNGIGEESANAETPTAASYQPGDIVDFTDSGDGSGTGVYLLMGDGSTWKQIAS